ncbi:MAG: hypothetical protein B193_1984 [Solidesulfovibrio magneticus str. Maddingley MBC34]|uniref:Uncharacterized protein n=1 Tax=Solidesulfovibrio magneticus str. Maddingley MBC34 TaxID=1206767 RepID=K6FL57_9BACT|nr:MAG: hypothetical protein B193_1984 [Solidesulfovibrio magneticus str. Maddingley MBC34]
MALGPGSKSSPAAQTTSPAPPVVATVELVFSEAVVADMIRCAEKRPNVEDGGRLLGFQDFADSRDVPTRLRIVALLPPGPRAQRSPTMLFQDGEWQDWAFSFLEGMAPDLLYLGSFHHHLSNGYDQFSAGDLEGYRAFLAAYPQRFNAFLGVLLHRPLPDTQRRPDAFLAQHCRVAMITPETVIAVAPPRLTARPDADPLPYRLRSRVAELAGQDMPWHLRREFGPTLAALCQELARLGQSPSAAINAAQDITLHVGPNTAIFRTATPGRIAVRVGGEEQTMEIEKFDPRMLTHGLQPHS